MRRRRRGGDGGGGGGGPERLGGHQKKTIIIILMLRCATRVPDPACHKGEMDHAREKRGKGGKQSGREGGEGEGASAWGCERGGGGGRLRFAHTWCRHQPKYIRKKPLVHGKIHINEGHRMSHTRKGRGTETVCPPPTHTHKRPTTARHQQNETRRTPRKGQGWKLCKDKPDGNRERARQAHGGDVDTPNMQPAATAQDTKNERLHEGSRTRQTI